MRLHNIYPLPFQSFGEQARADLGFPGSLDFSLYHSFIYRARILSVGSLYDHRFNRSNANVSARDFGNGFRGSNVSRGLRGEMRLLS